MAFLIAVEGAISASKKIDPVVKLADGGIHAGIYLKLVRSLTVRPVASVQVVEVKGIVDIHF